MVLFLCVQGLEIYLISSTKTLHQVTFELELKRGETMISGRFCIGPVRPVYTTGLTGCLFVSAVKSLTGLCANSAFKC